ncbi:dienelactone hydrolase family protein [Bradyrhizobium liaoningense]|uniref:dienelactone hydrolase family protein n=1 Tax=Bradyrhizobium liaoningense TaxID=43992 RepID=UPI001BAA44AA|nr:dienelactone hydrolase family protein [Bradyrhizobium liaoningense]MBR1170076.1 dienelactone hydrolase family protein [Bradyrhizobium liaoningense]
MHRVACTIAAALTVLLSTRLEAETLSFESVVSPSERTAILTGTLSLPPGPGPFPVVVLMHTCGGLDRFGVATLQAHAKNLQAAGFGAFILDSFGPRNLGGGKGCGLEASRFRKDDAFNAKAFLERNPKVSKDNLFALGLSSGGSAAIEIARGTAEARFRAAAAYYPECHAFSPNFAIQSPLLIFVAGNDDWTLPDGCLRAKNIKWVAGAEFDVVEYPNAHHGFDQQRDRPFKYRGHTLAYSPDATADSRKRVIDFFVRHLTDDLKTKMRKDRN